MVSGEDFIKQLVMEFPELRDEVEGEYASGLLHVQMGVFARFTQQAIKDGAFEKVHKYTSFANGFFPQADPNLDNALYVSYLEHIFFDDGKGKESWNYIPATLQKIYLDFMDALEKSASRPSKKVRKPKTKKQTRGSQKHRT